ncbi:hypothetical protein, partial [Pseudomonas sp. SWRI92]|uniref:hypothetical protein n=1 Tax=Pseudomonas sp. SWRI92 TaxID=2745499 RepID=UPI001EE25510
MKYGKQRLGEQEAGTNKLYTRQRDNGPFTLTNRQTQASEQNRVGGGFTSAVLSHHRTYGSVYGGSGYTDKPLIVSSI